MHEHQIEDEQKASQKQILEKSECIWAIFFIVECKNTSLQMLISNVYQQAGFEKAFVPQLQPVKLRFA